MYRVFSFRFQSNFTIRLGKREAGVNPALPPQR